MLRVLDGVVRRWSFASMAPLILTVGAGFIVFLWRLASLAPGLSPAEKSEITASQNLHAILNNPLNFPHKLLQYGFAHLEPNRLFFLRLPSVIFALVFCFCFYKLASGLFGRLIGVFSTLIFSTLPLLVICARQASPEIMYFAPVVLIWLYSWLCKSSSNKNLAWLLLLLSTALFAFTPGMFIWVLAAFVIVRKKIITAIGNVPVWISALGLAVIALSLVFIGFEGYRDHSILKDILLLPNQSLQLVLVVKTTAWMILSLFFRTGAANPLVLGHTPIFSVLLLALMVFGVYAMQSAARAKTLCAAGVIILAVLAAGLNGDIAVLGLGIASAVIFVAAGLRYLYIEWRAIFPRNPVPKTLALILIAAVTGAQVYYGLRYALVAWPNSAQTRTVYVLK